MEEQASDWLVRLRHRSVSTAELEEFAKWRREPGNAQAYDRAQAFWSESARLSSDPDIQSALHGTPRQMAGGGRYATRPIMAFASLVAVALVLVIGIMTHRPVRSTQIYQTAVGERSSLRLPDGSGVELDTDSSVTASISGDERRITLSRGQAFFHVAHLPDTPFVVDAGNGITVTATGTQFDVRRTGERVVVALVSGSVVVRRDDAELRRMRPGSVIEVAAGNGVVATSRTIVGATGWRGGHLSFRETPLVEAVAEINRYTEGKLVLRDAGQGAEPISGEFLVDDPEGFGKAVNALLGAGTIERQSEGPMRSR